MTEPITIGRNFYPDRKVFLWIDPQETFSGEVNPKDRLRLVFFEKGSGVLSWGTRREFIISPMLLCQDNS
jgi:hypothetical protein